MHTARVPADKFDRTMKRYLPAPSPPKQSKTAPGRKKKRNIPAKLARNSSGGHVSAATQFDVPYVAWEMGGPSTLFLRVDKGVQMEIDAQGTLQSAL